MKKLHHQKVATITGELMQAETELRLQILKYKTSNTELLEEKEEELSK